MSDQDISLIKQFSRLEWLLRRYSHNGYYAKGTPADPNRGQGRVLALLKIKPEITQKELATILDMRSQSLGELLAKLEKRGYIIRIPSEEDRRSMVIQLTDVGLIAAENIQQQKEPDSIFNCLNLEEQNSLSGYLSRITLAIEEQMESTDSRTPGNRPRSPFCTGAGPGKGTGPSPCGHYGPKRGHKEGHGGENRGNGAGKGKQGGLGNRKGKTMD